ncbi:MAG: SpoIIE family protein phosphatase [Acidobacteria bacterium]|nr:SpoIIE family protein phosphatase [Acidobacteriota bacterium]
MSDLDTILRPFCPEGTSAWKRRGWSLLLLGAPVIAMLGFWMKEHSSRGPGFRVEIDRVQAVRVARETASRLGFETAGWKEHLRFEAKPLAIRYLKLHSISRDLRARRFLPEGTASVLLMSPDNQRWVRVTMGMRGFVMEFRSGGAGAIKGNGEQDEAAARAVAQRELEEWLGGMAVKALGEPERSTTDEQGAVGARRFTWRVEPKEAPELELAARIDVLNGRVVGREIEPVYGPGFLMRDVAHAAAWSDLIGTLRVALIGLLVMYSIYRYARRTMESEAPHARVLVLMGMFVVVSALFTASNPDAQLSELNAVSVRGPVLLLRIVLSVVVSALFGLVLGVAYGAGEGEVRERWEGKLTSLDALLTGKVWSANFGVSVVAGMAWAGWLFGLITITQAVLGERIGPETMDAVGFTFGRVPMLQMLANAPLSAVTLTVLSLLAPLAFLRRHTDRGWAIALALIAVSMLVGGFGDRVEPGSAMYWANVSVITLAVLGPFYLQDYLASVVAVAAMNLLRKAADVSLVAPYWQDRALDMGLVVLAMAGPLAAAAWLGRKVEERDVRPKHASNLAERLSLQAELSAAREAQMRLLPDQPPAVDGLEIAAACIPAQEVRGDFYDFYRMDDGRVGMIVAEGGNEGLASALTIALAKGFLMWEASEGTATKDAVVRLEAALGASLNHEGGRTSLGLFLLDTETGALDLVRTGQYPEVLIVGSNGAVRHEEITEHEGLQTSRMQLADGEAALIYTDGLPRLMSERGVGTPAELLKKAAWFGQGWTAKSLQGALVEAVLGSRPNEGLSDDLTAVVVRRLGPVEREEVAA